MELPIEHHSMQRKKSSRFKKLALNNLSSQKLSWDINFDHAEELHLINPETQSKLYHKIRSFIILNSQKSFKKPQSIEQKEQKQKYMSLGSKKQQHKKYQQNQIINSLKPKLLPPVSSRLEKKKRNKKSVRSFSVIDDILTSKKSFMKTYFKDLKTHFNQTRNQYIQQLFTDIVIGQWKICGYLKGQFLLIKGINKKGKSIIKKYKYENVRAELRKNMKDWLYNHFVLYTQILS